MKNISQKIITCLLVLLIYLTTNLFSQSFPAFAWVKAIAGSNNENVTASTIDASGNIYVAGVFQGSIDVDPGPGTVLLSSSGIQDMFVAKYSSLGVLIWAKHIGGIENEAAYGITVDNAGNVYLTGVFENTVDFDPGPSAYDLTSAGWFDIFLLKLDPAGNFLWVNQCGGNNDEMAFTVGLDNASNVYISGNFSGTADFDPSPSVFNLNCVGYRDGFIAKFSANTGSFQWAKQFATTGSTDFCGVSSFVLDGSGNFYVTGTFAGTVDFDTGSGTYTLTSFGTQSNLYACKLDNTTAITWIKQIGASSAVVGSNDIKIDNLGNTIITGDFQGSCDFDPGSSTVNLTSNGLSDVFVLKLTNTGTFSWAVGVGDSGFDGSMKLLTTSTNDIIVLGEYQGTVDFDPGIPIYQISSDAGSWDIFMLKLSSAGTFEWVKSVGGPSWDQPCMIHQDTFGNLYITGRFSDTCDFDPDAPTFYLSATQSDAFILKLNASPTHSKENEIHSFFEVYPTITNNLIHIRSNQYQNYNLEIFDAMGRVVLQTQNTTSIPVYALPNGMYIIKIQNLTNDRFEYHRFVVQH
ncbi:MAG: T9SS type A sorting domain-containing protein [Bacteroidia bacterium]|nr:T9SS type A sorting domain-containing protein [Bacteroidia bacterium]MDW8348362.1 T9SS type A sorting domain-containing protein [Bacteroidia bacterium]